MENYIHFALQRGQHAECAGRVAVDEKNSLIPNFGNMFHRNAVHLADRNLFSLIFYLPNYLIVCCDGPQKDSFFGGAFMSLHKHTAYPPK